jgi:hypothetical protein
MRKLPSGKICALACVAMAVFANPTMAVTLGFDNLPGPENSPFVSNSEKGFTVRVVGNTWLQSIGVGNPAPSISNFPPGGQLAVTSNSSDLFTFQSVDVLALGSSNFLVEGLLNGGIVFSSGVIPVTGQSTFGTFLSPDRTAKLDTLGFVFGAGDVERWFVDNIVVAQVPEPSSLALLVAGLVGVLGYSLRRGACRTALDRLHRDREGQLTYFAARGLP